MNIKLKIKTKPKRNTFSVVLGAIFIIGAGLAFSNYLDLKNTGYLIASIIIAGAGIFGIIKGLKKKTEAIYTFENIESYEIEKED